MDSRVALGMTARARASRAAAGALAALLVAVLVGGSLLLLAAGCSRSVPGGAEGAGQAPAGGAAPGAAAPGGGASGGTSGAAAPSGGFPVTLKDGLGREITVPAEPQRIISLAPSNTEILFALGAGGRVVGVTDNCNYPPEAAQRERLGGAFDAAHVNFERVVALSPDLILGLGGAREVVERLEGLGLRVFAVEARNLDEVFESIVTVGRLVGLEKTARGLADHLRMRADRVSLAAASLKPEERPLVFFEIWPDPLMTAGPGTFIHDLIELAGGRNIAADADQPYPLFSLEALIARDPQVIVTTFPETVEALSAGTRPGWSGLSAVRDGRVRLVDQDLVSRPGPRLVEGLEAMARAIHPERFGGE
ncbi:MAG: cobalamin-binding protein [Acetobacteraceae bacterium]|nr:cobalamin-binding protein [Acetobacteraceae bacterium]